MNWQQQAACRGRTDLFYPDKGRTGQAAKTICTTCPVKAQCDTAATGEPYGIWAGKSPLQRGTSLHNRGQKHRIYEVAVCSQCDARFWTYKNQTGRGVLCGTCRADTEAVA